MTNKEALRIIKAYNELYTEARRLGYSYFGDELEQRIEKMIALGIEWGETLNIPKDFSLRKMYTLTNSATKYKQSGEEYLVHWDNGNIGAYQFVRGDEEYFAVSDEWEEFKNTLMAYNPVDYDPHNNHMIFTIEDGKKLMADYKDICDRTREKMVKKIKTVRLEKARKEYERLLGEQNDE